MSLFFNKFSSTFEVIQWAKNTIREIYENSGIFEWIRSAKSPTDSFDLLVCSIEDEPIIPNSDYRLKIDFEVVGPEMHIESFYEFFITRTVAKLLDIDVFAKDYSFEGKSIMIDLNDKNADFNDIENKIIKFANDIINDLSLYSEKLKRKAQKIIDKFKEFKEEISYEVADSNSDIGKFVKLKNGKKGIIEDYDDNAFYVKDDNGNIIKIKKSK